MQSGVDKAIRRAVERGYDPYNMADAAGAEYNRMRRRSGWTIEPCTERGNSWPRYRGESYVSHNRA